MNLHRLAALVVSAALAFALSGGRALAADGDGIIRADRPDQVAAQVGKAVILHGTVESVDVEKPSGHSFLRLAEGEVAVFIRKEHLEEHPDWDLGELVGKEVFVAGQAVVYKQRLQVTIIGPDQIAATADGFDLAKVPLPEQEKKPVEQKTGPAAPGAVAPSQNLPAVALKLDEASVQALVFYLKGTDIAIKDDPFGLPLDILVPAVATVTATVTDAPGFGAMQVAFQKPNPDSAERVQAMLENLAGGYAKWPRDKLVTVHVDFDAKDFKDDPPTLAIAVLIHALIYGTELSPELVISGDVAADGSIVVPVANTGGAVANSTILRAIAEKADGAVRLVGSTAGHGELNDFALDGDWKTLSSVSVLGAATQKDALRLISAGGASELGKALAAFDQVQAVIRKSGSSIVKNSQLQQRVLTAGKAWPANQSAVFYAFYARGKVARSYSPAHSYHLLKDLHTELRILMAAKPEGAKDRFKAIADQLKNLPAKLDPEFGPLTGTLAEFLDAAEAVALKPRDGRALERQEKAVKDADGKVVAGLASLAAKLDNGN